MKRKTNKQKLKKIFLLTMIMTCCFVFILTDNIANSADEEADEKVTEEIDDLEEKADDYRKMIELKQKQQNTLQNQLEIMNVNEEKIENNVQITKNEINEKEESIKGLTRNISDTENEIDETKNSMGEMLRVYYKLEKEITLSVLSSQGSLSDVFNHSEYLNQASQEVEKVLESVKSKKEELNKEMNKLEGKKADLENDEKKLESELIDLANEKRSKNFLLTKTKGEEVKYQKLLSDIEDEIYDLESGKVVDYGSVPASRNGYFDYPVSNVRITQVYGMTSFAKSGAYGGAAHNGIDFGVNYESIYAVGDGKVKAVGNNGGYAYGRWVAIDHGDGLITLYGHLSSVKVDKGEKVDQGDKIAISGNTGFSTGPHLHFSVFDAKSFEISNSKYVSGLKIPTGASINPDRYF